MVIKMKVSLELQPCLRTKSGIGIYSYEISKALQSINNLELIGDVFNFRDKRNIENYISDINFNINTCKVLTYGVYRRIWKYIPIKYNNLFDDKSDIYHFFDYIVPPRVKGKVVTTIHDLTYELYPSMVEKKTLNRIKKGIQYSIDRADKIITISESSKRDIINILNVDEHNIDIVPPGVDYNLFNKSYKESEKQGIRLKYKLPEKYILYMGTLEPRKNIESIVKAFDLFKKENDLNSKDIKLVIAGKKGWMFETIFDLVTKLNLGEDIVFTDYVDEIDKPIIYGMAKLFIFPSIYEGFGIPVVEAMAASVPVITSNISSLPEVAGDAAIMVQPRDSVSIAEYMNKILSDEVFSLELIKKGHIQAQKFTWEASALRLYEIYKSIL